MRCLRITTESELGQKGAECMQAMVQRMCGVLERQQCRMPPMTHNARLLILQEGDMVQDHGGELREDQSQICLGEYSRRKKD